MRPNIFLLTIDSLRFDKTFGEMKPKLKMSIDHRFKAFFKIKELFN